LKYNIIKSNYIYIYMTDTERAKEYQKEYYKKNKQMIKDKAKLYYEKNKEAYNRRQKLYNKKYYSERKYKTTNNREQVKIISNTVYFN